VGAVAASAAGAIVGTKSVEPKKHMVLRWASFGFEPGAILSGLGRGTAASSRYSG